MHELLGTSKISMNTKITANCKPKLLNSSIQTSHRLLIHINFFISRPSNHTKLLNFSSFHHIPPILIKMHLHPIHVLMPFQIFNVLLYPSISHVQLHNQTHPTLAHFNRTMVRSNLMK